MTEKTLTATDMVGFAASDNIADFQATFNQLATQRAAQEIEAAREYVGKSMTSGPGDEEESAEEELNDLEELDNEDENESDPDAES